MLSIGVLGELIVAYHDRAFRTFSISDRTDTIREPADLVSTNTPAATEIVNPSPSP
jgi:hypothetical protein